MFDSIEEILSKIQLGEDTSFELKSIRFKGERITAPERNDLADVITGMANTRDSVLVLGVNDKTREIEGIAVDMLEHVERYIFEICNDAIKPPVSFMSYRIELPDISGVLRAILKIDIIKSLFVHKSPNGYFHRQGSSTREIPSELLFRLAQQRSQARLIRYDEQSVGTAHRNSLDNALWEKFKTPLSPKDDEEFLIKLKLLTLDDSGNICPSVGGVLMATQQPHEVITNAFIQAVAYRGTERNAAYQLDARDIFGPLDSQVVGAYEFVKKNMKIYAVKEPGRRDIPQYDMKSVFEALVNAVAHRDYSVYGSKIRLHMFSDRLELFSPGTIVNTLTVDALPLRQSARNELLISLLARCPIPIADYNGEREFFMDKRGEGVPIIITESEKLSGKRPEYKLLDDAELMFTIYAAQPPKIKE